MAGPGRTGRRPGRPRGPGRPRRSSNSTVESIDTSQIIFLPETQILKKNTNPDIDAWPCFVLSDAVVYRKGKHGRLSYANICNVDTEGPFVIRGRLEISDADDPDNIKALRNLNVRSAYIEIPASYSYSIGFGPWPVVWASGEAGWFEINPARQYHAMYDKVCEGITLYYKMIDVYEELRESYSKSKKHKAMATPIDKVIFKYAVSVGDALVREEAEARCREHAPFLLAHFSKDKGFTWDQTSLYKWMHAQNPEILQRITDALAGKPAPRAPTPEGEDEDPNPISPTRFTTDRARRSKSRASKHSDGADDTRDVEMTGVRDYPKVAKISPIPLPKRVLNQRASPSVSTAPTNPAAKDPEAPAVEALPAPSAEPQTPIEFLLDLVEDIASDVGDMAKIKENTIHSKMYYKCTIKAYAAAQEVTAYYVKPLLANLPPKWRQSPFWRWLKSIEHRPWKGDILTEAQIPSQLVRRKKGTKSAGNEVPSLSQNRATRLSSSPPRRGVKHPQTPGSRLSGKNAGLRPSSAFKRRYDSDEEDDDVDRARKTAKTSHYFAEDDDEDATNGTSDVVDDTDVPPGRSTNGTEPIRIVVRAEKIPSMSPSGPNGTWTCEEEGCGYIVRSVDDQEGKDIIAAHFKDHEARAHKMNLALQEANRNRLPVNHLLEKIRSMGEKAKLNEQVYLNDTALPQPIKRRMIV